MLKPAQAARDCEDPCVIHAHAIRDVHTRQMGDVLCDCDHSLIYWFVRGEKERRREGEKERERERREGDEERREMNRRG